MLFLESWRSLMRRAFPRAVGERRRATVQLHCEPLEARALPSNNHLLIADWNRDCVRRYDGTTGAFVDTFVTKQSGGMNQPWGVLFGPHDQNLYVSTGEFGGPGQLKAVLRYDDTTGAFVDNFTVGGNLQSPRGIIFGPDGNLYVADRKYIGKDAALEGRIARFDGTTGAYLGDFVPLGSGGLSVPTQIVFAPSVDDLDRLDLYAVSTGTDNVLRYHGTTGAFLGEFVASGSGGVEGPTTFTFGPNGDLYVANFYSSDLSVKRFAGPTTSTPGAFIETFIPLGSGGLRAPSGLIYGPDGNNDGQLDLYLSDVTAHGYIKASVKRYDGVTGAFIDTFIPPRSGGLAGAVMISFTDTDPVTLAYNGGVPAPPAVPPEVGVDRIGVDQAPSRLSVTRPQSRRSIEFPVLDPMGAVGSSTEDRDTPVNKRRVRTAHGNTTWQGIEMDAAGLDWTVFVGNWEGA